MPADPKIAAVLGLPFSEQIAFFRAKLGKLVPTATWRDILRSQHDRAFMVAGAAKADLLADLAEAVDKAIAEGESLDKFRRRFGEIVKKHGWQGWTGSESEAGRNWRTRVIYRTNMSTSYAAGRLAQLKEYPLWVYRHSGAEHPRLQHKAWDGLALPADHPFWRTHYPPNGWGCGCRVVGARDGAGAARLGARPGYTAPPEGWDAPDARGRLPGIDEGWDYQPGATALRGILPQMAIDPPAGRPILPPICPDTGAHARGDCPGPVPRPMPFDPGLLLPDGKPAVWYVDAFLDHFGATRKKPVLFEDVTGEKLIISDELFIDRAKSAKAGKTVYKSDKRGRHPWLLVMAETLKHPQEVWEQWEWVGARDWMGAKAAMALRRRYLAWWEAQGIDGQPGLSVFEWAPKRWWVGVTTFPPEPGLTEYIDRVRSGVRRWPK